LDYQAAIQFLYDLQLFGVKLGLENTRRLATLAGHPEERLRFIHVAGTNGKGSTCAMLESIHRAAGRRVGLFTSPHLVRFGERIQVNRQAIGEGEVIRLVEEMRGLLDRFPAQHRPTFFEVATVMALRHFVEQKCDLVIWETGLGGRLDATNIVSPLASVITNVAFDHEQWLGNTLANIAAEKAGVIKTGVPVITATAAPEALAVIRAAAQLAAAPLMQVGAEATGRGPLATLELPLVGDHQRLNAATALATIEALQGLLPVPEAAVRTGLLHVQWAGRMQVVRGDPGQVNLLDGAHNPAAIEALTQALRRHYPGQQPAVLLGILQDKDWRSMCGELLSLAKSVCLVPVASPRSAQPEALLAVCAEQHHAAPLQVCHSLGEALRATEAEPFRLITGSLYLVGEALELLGAAEQAGPERGLNDWRPAPQARG
jgi:dihydrofolate synthase/folylpolyglutamate synthase